MLSGEALTVQVAEEFCDAQEWTRAMLRSRSWSTHRGRGSLAGSMSDDELLASAWAELNGEPVRLLANEGRCAELYRQGLTIGQVACELGVSYSTVRDRLIDLCVPRRRQGPRSSVAERVGRVKPFSDQQVAADYDQGLSLRELAKKYGVSPRTIRYRLRKLGRKCRDYKAAGLVACVRRAE